MMGYTRRLFRVIEGVIILIDDILIYANDHETLRQQTIKFKKALQKNLTLNNAKLRVRERNDPISGPKALQRGFAIDEAAPCVTLFSSRTRQT
jgi:hypothetical protein